MAFRIGGSARRSGTEESRAGGNGVGRTNGADVDDAVDEPVDAVRPHFQLGLEPMLGAAGWHKPSSPTLIEIDRIFV
ncbi:MAG TPA: hypothetical protein VMQ59_08735, partial [Acidimicrobiales bacterium]|nr:hypothetical protein [Acidimicrobiales bacterium]